MSRMELILPAVVVFTYVALGTLSWLGAWAWHSWGMFAFGLIWWGLAALFGAHFARHWNDPLWEDIEDEDWGEDASR